MTEEKRERTVRVIPAERYTRNLHVAAYVRVSSKKGAQDGSYETQAKYYENLIRSNPKWDFVGVYGDMQSGIHTKNRPGFQRMMDDALSRKIDLILCKSVSCWSRNTVDGLRTVNLLRDHFVYVIFEQEGINTEQFGSTLMLNTSMAIAQAESESTSDNLKWLYRRRAEAGVFVAHRGKYFGYDTDDGKFHPSSDADYVRMIYDDFIAGKTMARIADELNEIGLQTTKGLPWKWYSVRQILKSEIYVGDLRFQRKPSRHVITGNLDENQIDRYITDHHQGIVGRDIWKAAQLKFKERKEKYHAHEKDDRDDFDEYVWELIQDGWSGAEIADRLNITIGREKGCVKRLKQKGRLADRGHDSADDRCRSVLELIRNNPEITGKGIREILDLDRRHVDYALKKLKE